MPVIATVLLAAALAAADPADAAPHAAPGEPAARVPPDPASPAPAEPAPAPLGPDGAATPPPWGLLVAGGMTRLNLPGGIPVATAHLLGAIEFPTTGGLAAGRWLQVGASAAAGRTEAGIDVQHVQATFLLWSAPGRLLRVGAGVSAGLFSYRRATNGGDDRANTYGLVLSVDVAALRWRTGAAFLRASGEARTAASVDEGQERFWDVSLLAGVRLGRRS